MKKLTSIILTFAILLSVTACGAQNNDNQDVSQTAAAPEAKSEESDAGEAQTGTGDGAETAASEGFTMGVVVKVDVPWFDRLNEGLQKYAEENGCTINLYAPSTPDASQQVAIIEDLIAQKVDVIGIVPNSAEAVETVLQKARDEGIVVISHEAANLNSTDADIEAFTDQAFGEFFMQSLAESMGYEGEYATIIEELTNANHNAWLDAAVAYQKENYPDMTLVSEKTETKADVNQAQSICEELFKTYPELKGIMGTGSADVIGAGLAIENKGLAGKVAATGCTSPNDAAQYLNNGSISMIGLWDPANAGYAMCILAKMVMDGTTEFPEGVDLGIDGYDQCTVRDGRYLVGSDMLGIFAGDDVSLYPF